MPIAGVFAPAPPKRAGEMREWFEHRAFVPHDLRNSDRYGDTEVRTLGHGTEDGRVVATGVTRSQQASGPTPCDLYPPHATHPRVRVDRDLAFQMRRASMAECRVQLITVPLEVHVEPKDVTLVPTDGVGVELLRVVGAHQRLEDPRRIVSPTASAGDVAADVKELARRRVSHED